MINQNIAKDIKELNENFRQKVPQNISFRKKQLFALQRLLNENENNLCEALHKDLHKSQEEALNTEIQIIRTELIHHLNHFEEWAKPRLVSTDLLNIGGSSHIRADPLGVCLIIGPWNYPVHLTLLPMVGCISAGNCMLVKTPSNKYSNHSATLIAKLIKRYLDPQTVRVVQGNRSITTALLNQKYDLIFFTGGTFVGKMVARSAAENLTPTILELGGKSPVIIEKNTNISIAAKRVCWGRFLNAGQTCVAADYVFIHQEVAEEFYSAFEKCVDEFFTNFPEESQFFGRIVNQRAWKRLKDIINKDKKYLKLGGDANIDELYISPTLLDFGNNIKAFEESEAMKTEIFGPILPCFRFLDLDQVIDFINNRDKPLALYVFSETKSFYERILDETSSGICKIKKLCTKEMFKSVKKIIKS